MKKSVVFQFAIHTIITAAALIFGVVVLINIHNLFMRYKGKDVVLIHNTKGSGGTGWLAKGASGKRYVITNGHVCGLADEDGKVLVDFRGDTYILKVVKQYPLNDLCAIEAPLSATSEFGIANNYWFGEKVYTIGHPYLEPNTVTEGELSGRVQITLPYKFNIPPEQCMGPTDHYYDSTQIGLLAFVYSSVCARTLEANVSTVVILPGNSGSPTVNIWGRVVAVAFAANESGTRSYHVPLEDLKLFLGGL